MRAPRVDSLELSGLANPLDYIDGEAGQTLTPPGRLFAQADHGCTTMAAGSDRDKVEYARLTVQGLRFGKFDLALTIQANAETFVVTKRGGERQREAWHGAKLS